MTSARDIQMFGVAMLVVTVLAFWFNLRLALDGVVTPAVVGGLGLTVGVGGYVVGEIRREA